MLIFGRKGDIMAKLYYALRFLQRGSIRQRIFRLLLLSVVVVLITMSLMFLGGFFMIHYVLEKNSAELGEYTAGYIEDVTVEQITERLVDVAKSRAQAIETELLTVADDTEFLAAGVQNIIANRQNYREMILPDPLTQPIKSGEVYLHKGASLQKNGLSPDIRREIGLMGNTEAYISLMAQSYKNFESTVFVGSKNGYIIAADNAPGHQYVVMTDDFLQSYEPTERGWYKNAKKNQKITFNEIYVGAEGFPSFTCSAPYEDEHGFAGVVAIACAVGSLSEIMASAVVGETGISFIINDTGEVMLSTNHDGVLSAEHGKELTQKRSPELTAAMQKMMAGEAGWQIVKLDGEDYYLAYAPLKRMNWSFGALIAKNEVIAPAVSARQNVEEKMDLFRVMVDKRLGSLLLAAFFIVLLLMFVMFRLTDWLSKKFVRPIKNLTMGVQEIAAGNLTKKLSISTGDEFEALANCFNNMTDELQNYMQNLTQVTMEKEHIATELSVATEIQESMLPHIFPFAPERKEFDIYATMQAAKEVGGDFYDFYMLDEDHLLLTIADVSGKGVPAALFMVIAKTMLKNSALVMKDMNELSAVVARTNDQLCQNNDAMMFVTAFMGILELSTGRFNYVNAGHNPPLVYRRQENRYEYLQVKRNFVMGGMEDMVYQSEHLELNAGDKLFLYTDGITEALNEKQELFGDARLLQALNTAKLLNADSSEELLAGLKECLAAYVGSAEQSDDMTMLAVSYNGPAANDSLEGGE